MKEKTLPFTMVPNNYTLGMSISSSQGVVTNTPKEEVLQKNYNYIFHQIC